jgi:hypothetical protein
MHWKRSPGVTETMDDIRGCIGVAGGMDDLSAAKKC